MKLGTLLLQFFSRNASLIASTDHSSALGQWCYSILRATARDGDRLECLRKVLRARPDLPHAIRDKGRKGQDVAERLDWVESQMGLREHKLRRHDHLVIHSPQHLGALHDGLAMDPFGGELAGFNHLRDGRNFERFDQLRDRGRSRDRHLVPHHRGGYDRRVIEERVYPDLGPNIDEQLAGRAERSLLLREEQQGRRMLQLTMGRNFVDRTDLYGMGIGEPVVPRVARFPLLSEVEYDI